MRLEELEKKVELMKNKAWLGQKNWGVWLADDHTERQRGARVVKERSRGMENEREGKPVLVKEMREKVKKSFRNRRNERYDRE